MATNMFKKYTEAKTREWVVASGTLSGALVIQANSGRVGVTLTARGDSTKSQTLPDGTTITGINIGGVGNKPNTATVAVDGSWLFAVAGVTNGDTTGAEAVATPAGTKVYRTSAGALNLTVTGNTLIGYVDDGFIVGGVVPILIGAV